MLGHVGLQLIFPANESDLQCHDTKSNSMTLKSWKIHGNTCGSSNCDKLLPEDWIVHWRPVIWLTLHFSPSNSAMWSPALSPHLLDAPPSHQHRRCLLGWGPTSAPLPRPPGSSMRATPREWRSCNESARIIRDVTNGKTYENTWKDMSKNIPNWWELHVKIVLENLCQRSSSKKEPKKNTNAHRFR